jgi:hypothetical protein
MANRKVSLLWYCNTPRGWRRFPVLKSKNGRVRMGYVIEGGVERYFAQGHFELRHYEGRRTIFTPVGTNSGNALNARDRVEELQAKAALEQLVQAYRSRFDAHYRSRLG